mgnify:CR=1 FL=1
MASVVSEEGSKREESSPGSADREKIRVVVTGGTVGGGGGVGTAHALLCKCSTAATAHHVDA